MVPSAAHVEPFCPEIRVTRVKGRCWRDPRVDDENQVRMTGSIILGLIWSQLVSAFVVRPGRFAGLIALDGVELSLRASRGDDVVGARACPGDINFLPQCTPGRGSLFAVRRLPPAGMAAFLDLLDDLCREGIQVVRVATGDDALIGHHRAIHPLAAGIDHIRLDRVIRGHFRPRTAFNSTSSHGA